MPYYPVENTHKAVFPGAGKFHMPIIKPETDIRIDKLEWIPFDKIQKTKPNDRAGQGIHFYCVDRAFEAVWRSPDLEHVQAALAGGLLADALHQGDSHHRMGMAGELRVVL